MKKLYMNACNALEKAGTLSVQFGLIKLLLRNRLSGIDRMDVNDSIPAFVFSTQLYRISTMNGYHRKAGVLFM